MARQGYVSFGTFVVRIFMEHASVATYIVTCEACLAEEQEMQVWLGKSCLGN